MALTKRGKTWHTQFFVDGERFRQSLETSDWREAQRKERVLMGEAKAGKLAASKDDFSRLPFAEAAERFLEDRIPHLAPRSIQTERERVKPINKALGDVAVWRMTVGQVTAYIRERKTAGRSNATINRELDIIRGVLKRAKRWHHFAEEIHPLPVRQNIGRALTYEEKVKLLHRAGAEHHYARVRDQRDALARCGYDRAVACRAEEQDGSRGACDPAQLRCLGGDSGAIPAVTGARSD
jgi:hypothetical protein